MRLRQSSLGELQCQVEAMEQSTPKYRTGSQFNLQASVVNWKNKSPSKKNNGTTTSSTVGVVRQAL